MHTDTGTTALATIMADEAAARMALHALYVSAPDPLNLLGQEFFTLTELQRLHESVLGHTVDRNQFRRYMGPRLVPTGTFTDHRVGRPAELFTKP